MMWDKYYLPPDPTDWQGQDNALSSSFQQIIHPLNVLTDSFFKVHHKTFALLGFCYNAKNRKDGKEGPSLIRQALGTLPIQDANIQCLDVGNIICTDDQLDQTQLALAFVIKLLLQHDLVPIVLGGGHELSLGHYLGIAESLPDKNLGIINFDAHFDLKPVGQDAETTFLQIAKTHLATHRHFDYNCIGIQHAGNTRQLMETAKSYNTKVIWADELHLGQLEKCADFIDRVIDRNDKIYLSLCLNVFATPFAPGVSSTQPLGLLPWHIIPLVRQLAACGKVISYDIAELLPHLDVDQTTARLAANLIYEFIHHHNEQPRPW